MIYKKINNCTYLRVVNDLLFCDVDGICYQNWQKSKIPEDTILLSINDKIFYYEDNCLYEVVKPNGIINETFKYEPSSYIEPIKNYYFIFNRISRKEKNYRLVDKEKNVIWLDDKNWEYKILQDFIFLFEENKISHVNLHTSKELWHYIIPTGFKIFGSVQAVDDVLFFSCTDANLRNSKLVGLEIETGKVLWEFENLIDFQIDHKNKLLRGYQGAYYQVIDPFKGKLLINKDLKELWDKGIDPTASNNTITEDKLWFVSGRGEKSKFGAIDIATSEIDFVQSFPLENDAQLDKPIFHEGKLYLHDSNNILYVLE